MQELKRIIKYCKEVESIKGTEYHDLCLSCFFVMMIGEQVKRLPLEFQDKHAIIPWHDIAKMRDVLAHNFENVKEEIVWDVKSNHIPKLKEYCEELLKEEKHENRLV